MKYRFNITEDKFLEGKKLIRQNGGNLYTDKSFSISGVSGIYSFSNGLLVVNITDKPWLASWGMIEYKLKKFFQN